MAKELNRTVSSKTFKDWFSINFDKENLKAIASYGANTGWPGITYFSETATLYSQFKEEIWEILCEDMESCGYDNVFEFISSFRLAKNVCSSTDFENMMVWYAVERLAHQAMEEEDEE